MSKRTDHALFLFLHQDHYNVCKLFAPNMCWFILQQNRGTSGNASGRIQAPQRLFLIGSPSVSLKQLHQGDPCHVAERGSSSLAKLLIKMPFQSFPYTVITLEVCVLSKAWWEFWHFMPHGVEVEMVQHCPTCLKVSRKLVHLVLGRRYQDGTKKINCSAPPIDAVDGDALPRSRRPLLRQRLSGEQCWLVFAWTPVWQKAGVSVGTLGFTMGCLWN